MPNMKVEIECHRCNHEFIAEWEIRGSCPNCGNKYDWAWDGELWSKGESCIAIFESQSKTIKEAYLLRRDWV